jgi:hypothetical protein
MEYLQDLANVLNYLDNYYDHPYRIAEDHNDRPAALLFNGKHVDDLDSKIKYSLEEIERRERALLRCRHDLESIQRHRSLDLKYPDNPED